MNGYAQSWGVRPFTPHEQSLYGALHTGFSLRVVRLSVGDGWVEAEWLPCADAQTACYTITVARRGQSVGFANNRPAGTPEPQKLSVGQTCCRFDGLINDVDYELTVFARDEKMLPVARSLPRLFQTRAYDGLVVNTLHPDDYTMAFAGRSLAAPSLVTLPSGVVLVSHGVTWPGAPSHLTVVFRSEDGGRTFRYAADFCPCAGGQLVYRDGQVHLVGRAGQTGALLSARSADGGLTWSAPEAVKALADAHCADAALAVSVQAGAGAFSQTDANILLIQQRHLPVGDARKGMGEWV